MFELVKSIILSILFIAIIHYFWMYIKSNFSICKTKDIVKIQTAKYEKIINTMLETQQSKNINDVVDIDEIENDLAIFLDKTLLNNQ
jgi:hypothetical protein